MNGFFLGMKFNYLFSINFRNFIFTRAGISRKFCNLRKVYNESQVVSSVRIFMPTSKRNFMIYTTSFSDRGEHRGELKKNTERSRTKSQKQVSTVSVIDENNVERVMTQAEAEKFAKRKNLTLVLLRSTGDKVKYKLDKLSNTSGSKKEKQKEKRISIREETEPHDIATKINKMLKFVDRGIEVICLIEGSGNKEKQAKIIELLHQSKLKESFISKMESKKRLQILYRSKSTVQKSEPEKVDNKEADTSE